MKFLNKKFGLSAPTELSQTAPSFAVGTQLKFSQVIYTLIPEDEYRGIPAKYAKSIDRRVGELERLHYEEHDAAQAEQ